MDSTRIFLTNLPQGISEGRLTTELRQIFANVKGSQSLQTQVFRPDGLKQKAVAFNFKCNFKEMQDAAKDRTILTRNVVVHNDNGRERDEYGEIMRPEEPEKHRAYKLLCGETRKKVTRIFTDEFWTKINKDVYDGVRENTVTFDRVNLKLSDLRKVSSTLSVIPVGDYYSRIKFETVLDTLQAIRKLNLNEELCYKGCFIARGKNIESQMSDCLGLGISGKVIKIKDASKHDVIELAKLDASIVNESLQLTKLKCLRCKQFYKIEGLQINLNFLAAKCSCFDSKSNDNYGFFWPGEDFTRLTVVSMFSNQLEVWHYPMKFSGSYESAEQYKDIVLPLMFTEWKFNSRPFKRENARDGWIHSSTIVDVQHIDGRLVSVYAVAIKIRKSSFWNTQNRLNINMLSLEEFQTFQKRGKVIENKARMKVLQLKEMQDSEGVGEYEELDSGTENCKKGLSFLIAFGQVPFENNLKPVVGSKLKVLPKMDKSSYNSAKAAINRWAKEKKGNEKTVLAQRILLDPHASYDWAQPLQTISEKLPSHTLIWRMQQFRKRLNTEQKTAVGEAMKSAVSVIHGPPGTGKTYTLTAVALTLWLHEKGVILATAPSNVACDNLCRMIKTASGVFKPTVLRIYAKRRELAFIQGHGLQDKVIDVDCLHDMVRGSANFFKSERIQEIDEKIRNGNRHMLTAEEVGIYSDHVATMELEVISKYDVLVCTYGALCDHRVARWNSKSKITSVLADEAAQATQPDTLPIFLIGAKRYVFAGDHKQLTSGAKSSAAKSGLNISILEWISKAKEEGKSTIPWTTLVEQHRMGKTIRKLVSKFSYNDLLRDADVIASRTFPYAEIYSAVRNTVYDAEESTVVVYSHNEPEEKVGSSFQNVEEATHVANLVSKLLGNGVPAKSITILTLYEAQRKLMQKKTNDAVDVKNVDGYQGKENDVIIVSLTRCNDSGSMGFTSEKNRLNVAFSRARFQLFIFASLDTISNNQKKTWLDLTKYLNEVALIKYI